jgi:ABC-type sugar transport system substrate-binding protein
MRKNMLKMFAVLMAIIIVFGLTACTSKEPGTSASEKSATENKPAEEPKPTGEIESKVEKDEPIRIGVSTLNLSNPFFVALTDAAKKYGEEHGVEIMINDSQDKAERQVAALENFIASGCKAIVVTAVDPEAILPVVKNARSQGIKVVCHTTKLAEYDA